MDEQGSRAAGPADAAALTRALAAAFEDDPIFGWLLPDRRRRYERLLRFFALELQRVVHLGAFTVLGSPPMWPMRRPPRPGRLPYPELHPNL